MSIFSYLPEKERRENRVYVTNDNQIQFNYKNDLSSGVKISHVHSEKISHEMLAAATAEFMFHWLPTLEKLNGFPGLDTIKWSITK